MAQALSTRGCFCTDIREQFWCAFYVFSMLNLSMNIMASVGEKLGSYSAL